MKAGIHSLFVFQVPVNPSESRPPGKAPALSLAPESFAVQSSGQTHSYTLIVRVYSDNGEVMNELIVFPMLLGLG